MADDTVDLDCLVFLKRHDCQPGLIAEIAININPIAGVIKQVLQRFHVVA